MEATESDLAYLAGIVDGEGYVGIVRKKSTNKYTANWYQAVVVVRMKAHWLMERMKEQVAGATFCKNRQGLWGCEWRGKHAGLLLQGVLPYLKHKKPQAFGVLDYLNLQAKRMSFKTRVIGSRSVGSHGERPVLAYNEEYISLCEDIYKTVKSFNAVGKDAVYKASYVVPKGWGYEVWIVNKVYCGKKLYIHEGKKISWHYHNKKDETFFVAKGELHLYYGWDDAIDQCEHVVLTKGDTFHVPINLRHRLQANQSSEVFEFSTHHEDADSIRIIKGD